MKKVLIVVLILFILVALGVGGYFGYIKIIQPKLAEREQQDMAQVDALGSLLNQGQDEPIETMGDYMESQPVVDDGDILSGNSDNGDILKSAPTTDIPISDDSTASEALAYLTSLSEDDAYNVIKQVMEAGNEIGDFQQLKSRHSSWTYMVVDKDYVDSHDTADWKKTYNEIAPLFNGESNAEKKIEIVQGVMTKYASTETKQQFEYYGIQTGRYIVAREDNGDSVGLWYVSEDNVETVVNQNGYLAYLVIRVARNGDMLDFSSELPDIISLMQSIENTCASDSKYKLYTTLRTAIEYVQEHPEVMQNSSSEDGDVFGDDNKSGGIGETLGESGQL